MSENLDICCKCPNRLKFLQSVKASVRSDSQERQMYIQTIITQSKIE